MEIFNLLAVSFYNDVHGIIKLDFIGKFIQWLVTITGSVGIGIILFSLTLKLITLPFDVYQRITMRKQNNQMKANQEKMEKLQKQYANDKDKYNQKVMEMYKENGMSIFSSCLPMILSMVIFFVAIGAFNSYAAYANAESYNTLVRAYNSSVESYGLDIQEIKPENVVYVTKTENGQTVSTYSFKEGVLTASYKEGEKIVSYEVKGTAADDYLYYKSHRDIAEGENVEEWYGETSFATIQQYLATAPKTYEVDTAKVDSSTTITKEDLDAAYQSLQRKQENETNKKDEATLRREAYDEYFTLQGQKAVKEKYDQSVKGEMSFLWIKNIWVTDASYEHPIQSYTKFETQVTDKGGCGCSKGKAPDSGAYSAAAYAKITGNLTAEKKQANGYFILIALSIGTILLQQFVSMRAQKEQQKYSSVDGQGAGQQKMMMFMMTGMFAIFSFMYSSAFSIYLVVSNLFSMLSMFIINKIVDAREKNKKEETAQANLQQNRAAKRIEEAKAAGVKSAQQKRNGEKTNKK